MEKDEGNQHRERVGLAIFFALLIIGGLLICSYFFMGRQLNTTATVVDEVTGNMQDYSLIVFSGLGDASSGDSSPISKESTGDDVYASTLGQSTATVLKDELSSAYKRAKVKGNAWRNHVFVSDVRNNYELKGAEVVTIDLSDFGKYSDPTIIDGGSRKFGVFSIKRYLSKAKLKVKVNELQTKGADSIVCIAESVTMLPSFNGIDAVISLDEIDDEMRQSPMTSTILIETPAKGNVGVLLFSNANATSYKTIKTL